MCYKMKLFQPLVFSLIIAPISAMAQSGDSMHKVPVVPKKDESKISILQFHQTVGILQNRESESMMMLTTTFSVGSKIRFTFGPAMIKNKPGSGSIGYMLAGLAAQHRHGDLLFETSINMNIDSRANNFAQIGAGLAMPLLPILLFKFGFSSQYEERAKYSGNTLHVGLIIQPK